jgi:hypothetical protein
LSGYGLPAPVKEMISSNFAAPAMQYSTKPTLVITVRSTNRQLVDQTKSFIAVAKACNHLIDGGIQVIIDGPCLQAYKPDHTPSHPEYQEISILAKELRLAGIRTLSIAGISLIDQIRLMRNANCVLTYFSGGNCKFTGIVNCPIIFLCPPCNVSEAHIRNFSQLPLFYASSSIRKHFRDYHFFMDPSYLVYPSNSIPYLTPSPAFVERVSSDLGLASDFKVDTDHLIELTIKSLSYSIEFKSST